MAVLVIALSIIMLTLIAMVRQIAISASSVRMHKDQSQIEWLLESGIERAKVQRQGNPDFTEETWEVDVFSTGSIKSAVIEIRVDEDGKIHVEASLPSASGPATVVRRSIPFSFSTKAKT